MGWDRMGVRKWDGYEELLDISHNVHTHVYARYSTNSDVITVAQCFFLHAVEIFPLCPALMLFI